MKDIYFEKNYGKLYEEMEDGETIKYEFDNEFGSVSNLFIKREIPITLDRKQKFYDITTPYGYGGPIVNQVKKGRKKDLLNAYEENLKKYCLENNIVSEFIRFHPILENANDFKEIYDINYMRKTVGTNLKDYEDPFQSEFSKSAKKNVRRALRDGVSYEVIPEPETIDDFIKIYYSTMDRNDADDAYYFDNKYFNNCLKYFKSNIVIVKAKFENKTIAMGFYFKYGDMLHTHLSGTLTEYLHLSPAYVLRYALTEWGKENGYSLIHHGGATTNDENDSLYRFKKRFGQNTEFKFHIGTKVWNEKIYYNLCDKVNQSTDSDFFPAYRNSNNT